MVKSSIPPVGVVEAVGEAQEVASIMEATEPMWQHRPLKIQGSSLHWVLSENLPLKNLFCHYIFKFLEISDRDFWVTTTNRILKLPLMLLCSVNLGCCYVSNVVSYASILISLKDVSYYYFSSQILPFFCLLFSYSLVLFQCGRYFRTYS